MITLTTTAIEGSTIVVTAATTDENGTAVTPDTAITWTLENVRTDTQISTGTAAVTSASTDIVISGLELASGEPNAGTHDVRLIVETTYTSSAGTGLPLKDVLNFRIYNPTL